MGSDRHSNMTGQAVSEKIFFQCNVMSDHSNVIIIPVAVVITEAVMYVVVTEEFPVDV